jgi:phytoene dehydrogenase-like protein
LSDFDAVVVGSGPNGLSAAATLAETGRKVLVIEGSDTIGGGTRTEELTLPGFRHDVCSAFHPLAMGSPFFGRLPLAEHGLEWVQPDAPLGHAIAPGRSVVLERDIAATAAQLGLDGATYHRLMSRWTEQWPMIAEHVLGPLVGVPAHPVAVARFGLNSLASARFTTRHRFESAEAKALFAGCAAHAFLPLTHPLSASFGWLLMVTGHVFGWPVAKGGSQSIADALTSYIRSLGGVIETGRMVGDLAEIPATPITILDITPTAFATIAGDRLPSGYLKRARRFRYGPAAFKVDFAVDRPIPWADPQLARAGTVHIGGTDEDINRAETQTFGGTAAPDPFVLVGQQSLFDDTRAPEGKHTVWAYAHVPNGSDQDFTDTITRRIEEMAPGFSETVLATHVFSPADLQSRNPNYVGGDISGGAHSASQLIFRPFPQMNPYTTPIDGVYLGSSSTPPGGGSHGMCGHNAAMTALERM